MAPCDGVPVDEQDMIELLVPICGLDDAPIRWYETVIIPGIAGTTPFHSRPMRRQAR